MTIVTTFSGTHVASSFDSHSASSRVHIIGAGLLGSLLAWRLARTPSVHSAVELWEAAAKHQPTCAGKTAAAMIAPMAEAISGHPEVVEYGFRSLALWPLLIDELAHDTGERVMYQQTGSLLVAHPADEQELTYFTRQLEHKLAEAGTHHSALTRVERLLSNREITALEPDISPQFQRGLFLPAEAFLHQRQLLSTVQHAHDKLGVVSHYDTCIGDDACADLRARGVLSERDIVIDCRGTGAKHALDEQQQQLRGVRGEVVWIECKTVNITRAVRLLHPRYSLYLVPKGDGIYMLGATEIESEDRSPFSVRSALEMLSALYTLVPAFAEARIIELDVNLRPALAHHQVRVAQDGEQLWSVNGLYRHGYLQAPAVLEQLQAALGAFMPHTAD